MADNSHIEWTEATWNIITGCSVVSPGCTNCYAMRLAGGRLAHHPSREGLTVATKAGPVWTGEVRFNPQWLDLPLRWTRPRRIFVCAHGDLFHEDARDEWIDMVFAVMALAPQHTYQVLTKRPAQMAAYFAGIAELPDEPGARDALIEGQAQALYQRRTGEDPSMWLAAHMPLPNVWLGVSAEDQERLVERLPLLIATPAAVRWLSLEPLLGPIDPYDPRIAALFARVDWVVVGGESGPGARWMDPQWVEVIRDACAAMGVRFFMKQMHRKAPIPAELRIREYPVG